MPVRCERTAIRTAEQIDCVRYYLAARLVVPHCRRRCGWAYAGLSRGRRRRRDAWCICGARGGSRSKEGRESTSPLKQLVVDVGYVRHAGSCCQCPAGSSPTPKASAAGARRRHFAVPIPVPSAGAPHRCVPLRCVLYRRGSADVCASNTHVLQQQ